MLLKSNNTIEQLATWVSGRNPNWDSVLDRVREGNYIDEWKISKCPLQSAMGKLGELITRDHVTTFAENEGLPIVVDPINGTAESPRYSFQFTNNSLFITRSTELTTYGEIDLLLLAEDDPLIVEVKLTNRRKMRMKNLPKWKRDQNKLPSPGDRGFNYTIGSSNSRRITKPIREYFGKDPGFAVVGYPFVCCAENHNNTDFVMNNGMLIPFYADRHVYQREVEEILSELGVSIN